jgi:hypothetical protein
MKPFFLLLIMSFSCASFAWLSPVSTDKEYSFKFKYEGENLVLLQKATSYEEAYEKAAQSCFQHFKGGRKVAEQKGLDIIDVCANPRS